MKSRRAVADWNRLFLCEIYLEIISGSKKPSLSLVLRNIVAIVYVKFTAEKIVVPLIEKVRENPQFDPNGHHIARYEMILGLLYKAIKKQKLAIQHLSEANRISAPLGSTPMLAKIEAALAEMG
jgi:hypothetical protein